MLLVTVSERLKRIIRKRDTVARLGGDEFAVVLHDVGQPETQTVAVKMIRSIEADILIEDSAYSISCSVGVAMYPDHGQDPKTLLLHADIAMHEAKGNGLAWRFFEQGPMYDNLLPSDAPNRPVCILQEGHG
ncbi:MAG TPA: GGDEF domain-containing protein [Gammaproteobacteria bacterium]|nr:GGDEF domain-containing protein [Gammaproteobacteria bacterium]